MDKYIAYRHQVKQGDLIVWRVSNESIYGYKGRCAVNDQNGWHPLSKERIAESYVVEADSYFDARIKLKELIAADPEGKTVGHPLKKFANYEIAIRWMIKQRINNHPHQSVRFSYLNQPTLMAQYNQIKEAGFGTAFDSLISVDGVLATVGCHYNEDGTAQPSTLIQIAQAIDPTEWRRHDFLLKMKDNPNEDLEACQRLAEDAVEKSIALASRVLDIIKYSVSDTALEYAEDVSSALLGRDEHINQKDFVANLIDAMKVQH